MPKNQRVARRITRTRSKAAATTSQIDPFGSFSASTTATPKPAAITITPAAMDPQCERRRLT